MSLQGILAWVLSLPKNYFHPHFPSLPKLHLCPGADHADSTKCICWPGKGYVHPHTNRLVRGTRGERRLDIWSSARSLWKSLLRADRESLIFRPGESHFQSKGDIFPTVKVKCEVKIAAQEGPTELKAESEDFALPGCIVMSWVGPCFNSPKIRDLMVGLV